MALHFEDLKQVDERTKDLVNGFLKSMNNDENSIIPSLIASICILFYNLQEFFTICGDDMIIDDTLTKVTTKAAVSDDVKGSCYGNIKINNKFDCIYTWKLNRIASNGGYTAVGICSNKTMLNRTYGGFGHDSYFYKIASTGIADYHQKSNRTEFDVRWYAGDKITVHINTRKRSFEVSANNDEMIVIFDNIKFEPDVEYYFGIANHGWNQEKLNIIELLSFTRTFLD